MKEVLTSNLYLTRTFWSPDRRHLVTVHYTDGDIVTLQDDNGREWEATGTTIRMEDVPRPAVETTAFRSVEGLRTLTADRPREDVPVTPCANTAQQVSDKDLARLIKYESESDIYRALVELWERRPAVKTTTDPSASTDDNATPSRQPSTSSVECPKCRTLLAFQGDQCWSCSKEER